MEVINTNIMSLTAQNNLTKSQSSLATAMDQLSSGLRITSAASDAAGMAIATGFTTQINGLNQAIQNANNGLSLAQTAGSALSSITANLQRIRQLAVESANATNSSANRQQINQEVQQRLDEITRVASQTTFNGQHVLDGTFGQAAFQVGANVGQTITVNMTQGTKATQMGSIATVSSGYQPLTALAAGDLTLALANGTTAAVSGSANFAGANATYQGGKSAYAITGAINAANLNGVTAVAYNNQAFSFSAVTSAASADAYSLSVNGVNVLSATATAASQSLATAQGVVNAVNAASSQTGVTAAFDSKANIILSSVGGGDISVTQTLTGSLTSTGLGVATAGTDTTVDYVATALTSGSPTAYSGDVQIYSQQAITVAGNTPGNAGLTAGTTAIDASKTLATQNVDTVAASNQTIFAVDSALATINSLQANLGAVQNRFSSAIGNQTTVVQNLTQARSRIQDANFASATADLSRAQVLQQAGISVLAQANQMPQLALKLLR